MSYPTDRDGKSKTASGVDAPHYPKQHEARDHPQHEIDSAPTPEEIEARARELASARGADPTDQDRLQAAADLKRELQEHAPVTGVPKQTGTVQR